MKNVKVIIGIIVGTILVSSISVYATATYLYNATDVGYNNTNVSNALDDLYSKVPNGTKTITTKESNIDVGNYKYADTTGLYTLDEVQTGKGTSWNSGTNSIVNGSISIPVGFVPTETIIELNCGSQGSAIFRLYGINGDYSDIGYTNINDNKTWWISNSATGAVFNFNNNTKTWQFQYANWNGTVNWVAIK